MPSKLKNAQMTLGPNFERNKIYQEIKKNTEFIQNDVIALYRGSLPGSVRLQLGGF
jgi:hypothetical protein